MEVLFWRNAGVLCILLLTFDLSIELRTYVCQNHSGTKKTTKVNKGIERFAELYYAKERNSWRSRVPEVKKVVANKQSKKTVEKREVKQKGR